MSNNPANKSTSIISLSQSDPPKQKNLIDADILNAMEEQMQEHPQRNYEFLSQLAHITSDGGTEMQESLQQMTSSLQSNQALQASALVGRKVLVKSDFFEICGETQVSIVIDITEGLSEVDALIYSEYGAKIRAIPLEKPNPGIFQFSWDGVGDNGKRVNEGRYRVKVRAVFQGMEVQLQPLILANVDSVSIEQYGEKLKLNVAGIGSISLDQVQQISI